MIVFALMAFAASQPPSCPVPTVGLARADEAMTARYADGSPALRALEANVGKAFRSACAKGLIRGERVAQLSGASSRRIFLENWPDANVASLEADQLRDGNWRLVLGYAFVASDGKVNLIKAEEIEEAIYCAVKGATKKEMKESGRCLVD